MQKEAFLRAYLCIFLQMCLDPVRPVRPCQFRKNSLGTSNSKGGSLIYPWHVTCANIIFYASEMLIGEFISMITHPYAMKM